MNVCECGCVFASVWVCVVFVCMFASVLVCAVFVWMCVCECVGVCCVCECTCVVRAVCVYSGMNPSMNKSQKNSVPCSNSLFSSEQDALAS